MDIKAIKEFISARGVQVSNYRKAMLSSWRSFEEYNLCLNGHVQSLSVKTVQDLDGSSYFVFVAGVIPTQEEKTQEDEKYYRL